MSIQDENGLFQNLDGCQNGVNNMLDAIISGIKNANRKPPHPIESVSFYQYNLQENQFVWFGHSFLLFRLHNQIIAVDPVLENIPFQSRFKFTESHYTWQLPNIDVLLLTHNHYDHFSVATLRNLKVSRVICPLRLGQSLEFLRSPNGEPVQITELDWFQSADVSGLLVTAYPSRHYSARGLCDKRKTLWCSFSIGDIFLSGDGSFNESQFRQIREHHGQFQFAFIECGQYSTSWPDNHLFPPDTFRVHEILGARMLIPIHFGAYCLAQHDWNETPRLMRGRNDCFVGKIGEIYSLDQIQGGFIDPCWV